MSRLRYKNSKKERIKLEKNTMLLGTDMKTMKI